jgi:hypothetical protein
MPCTGITTETMGRERARCEVPLASHIVHGYLEEGVGGFVLGVELEEEYEVPQKSEFGLHKLLFQATP